MIPIVTCALAALIVSLWLASFVLCAPLVLTALRVQFHINKKMFLQKLGAHVATPLWWGSALITYMYIAGVFYTHGVEHLKNPFFLGVIACLLAQQVVFAMLALKWNLWRTMPGVHTLACAVLGTITAALLLPAVAGAFSLLTQGDLFWSNPVTAVETLMNAWFTQHLPVTLAAIFYMLCTGFASCTTIGALWLLLRRNKDDFGRDYYTYATRTLALWTGASSLALAGLLAFFAFFAATANQALYYAASVAAAAALLWFAVGASSTPLRQKLCRHWQSFFSWHRLFCNVCPIFLYSLFLSRR